MLKLTKFMFKYERTLLILGGALALSTVLVNLEFSLLEANLYDWRMVHEAQPSPDNRIVISTLDDEATKALDDFAPLPLSTHVKFLDQLAKLNPAGVGYLIDLNPVSQANADTTRQKMLESFLAIAQKMEKQGTTFLLGTPYDVTGEVLPPYPLGVLPHAVSLIHKDGNVFADDKVTRRAFIGISGHDSFDLEFAKRLGVFPKEGYPRGSFYLPEIESRYVFFKYRGEPTLESAPYAKVSFLDILQGKLAPGSLKGKFLLVGTLSKDDPYDYSLTPYSKNRFPNPKVLIHANILDSIIHNDGISRAPNWTTWLLTFSVTSFVLFWVLTSTPLAGLFFTLGLAVITLILGQSFFQVRGIWLRESQPLVGIFVGYYLSLPYRLIREYKKRWVYQRKNQLLTQVEELKTNFLSLVTHDLKTPVARIQGLAEVLLRKSSERLVARDQETLHHIIASTDELNRFITSILELSKVESDDLKVHLESKDINQLIERCMDQFKAAAKVKGVKLISTLDPLFPIRMDSVLISKVINNLIDNAIKYSASGSEVRIQTQEVGDQVEISVCDQGIGMSNVEQEKLFTRFYRVKNESMAHVSGTGLGLYLTKFFIGAHKGTVEVRSEKGKGTEFRILLPFDPDAVLGSSGGLTRLGMKTLFQKKEKAHV